MTWRLLLAGLTLAAALAGPAAPAWAHAVLVDADPVDGAELESAPSRVTLRFNEAVSTTAGGGLRVFDAAGERVDTAAGDVAADTDVVAAELRDDLGAGTYMAAYRVVSADGHPVKGALVFTVGKAGQVDESLLSELLAGEDGVWGAVAGLGRAVGYAAALVAAGGVGFLRWVHRGGAPAERARLLRLVRRTALVGLAATGAGVALQGALISGLGAAGLVQPTVLGDTLASPFGVSSGLRAAGLVALAAGTRPSTGAVPRWVLAGAVVTVGSYLLAGHTMTSQPRALVMAADLAHLLAAAAWAGGLVLLAVVLRTRRRSDEPLAAARVVVGFSRLATVALFALTAAGLALAWVEVRALRALVSTPYGWTLLAKVAVVAVVLAAAAYNHRRLVPAVARAAHRTPTVGRRAVPAGGSGEEPPMDAPRGMAAADRAWRRLSRTVRFEAVGLAVVVVITAFLTYLQPAADAAGITGAFSTYQPLGDDYEVNLVVDPNRAGVNEVHLYVLDATGRPAGDVGQELTLRMTKPDEDIGPIERDPTVAGPGHWLHVGPELSIPGRWQVEIVLQVSDFQELRTQIPVTVNP